MINNRRKPEWLKINLPMGELSTKVMDTIRNNRLNTICTSGMCPNKSECWGCGTATFMISGDICTRSCKFCNVKTGLPKLLDKNEPQHIADSIKELNMKHLVLTSVDRDDLDDLGADHWVKVINKVKETSPQITMEVLIPDFQGRKELVQKIIDTKPNVISHNLETSKRLTPSIRSVAKYDTSLDVLKQIADSGIIAKTGIMLGLGETREEILETMKDALNVGCKVFTLGQYLQPSVKNIDVKEYIHPDTFKEYKKIGLEMGFRHVESSPFVRSSYHAERHIK